jgi:hypothetical protein
MLRRTVVQTARYGSNNAVLNTKGINGAGTLCLSSEICADADGEEERRRPQLEMRVAPRHKYQNRMRTAYKWGFDSTTLHYHLQESTGPWWNANCGKVQCTWNSVGEEGAAGMWSNIPPMTLGVGEFNKRPNDLYQRAIGKRDKKSGALVIDYEEDAAVAKTPVQQLVIPHAKEHQMHQRYKVPANKDFKEIQPIHYKRSVKECQYHLGAGYRYFLVDGVFGSNPATGTPYRVITDNGTHGYFASMSALRKFNYVAMDESVLVKRTGQSPIEEWSWRRPGVLCYHCPSFDFESPRIVEEFGGPRTEDLGLAHNKFTVMDPYAIPMKVAIAGQLECETILKNTAYLCARWGFYADGRKLVTLNGDGVLSKDAKELTVIVTDGTVNLDAIRANPLLFSAHHVRIGDGIVSRCWDSASLDAKTTTPQDRDIVETSTGRIHRPFASRMGATIKNSSKALGHRLFGRRKVTEFGYKSQHNYTTDAAEAAALGGHLFNPCAAVQKSKTATGVFESFARPSSFNLSATNFIVVGSAAGSIAADVAAKAVISGMSQNGWLYAEEDKLQEELTATFSKAKSVTGVATSGLAEALAKL